MGSAAELWISVSLRESYTQSDELQLGHVSHFSIYVLKALCLMANIVLVSS